MDVSSNQRSERYSSEGYGGWSEEAANYAFCTVLYVIPASKSETCDHMYLDFSSIHIHLLAHHLETSLKDKAMRSRSNSPQFHSINNVFYVVVAGF